MEDDITARRCGIVKVVTLSPKRMDRKDLMSDYGKVIRKDQDADTPRNVPYTKSDVKEFVESFRKESESEEEETEEDEVVCIGAIRERKQGGKERDEWEANVEGKAKIVGRAVKEVEQDKISKQKQDKEICLAHWWEDLSDLSEFNYKEVEELVNEPRSHLFYYLWKAEKFQETYGDSAFPTEERFKRRKYEVAAGVQAHLYKEMHNRKRVHDPKCTSRCNKRRKVEEVWEDYGHTWIARWDTKPCGCVHCVPCPVCGKSRCITIHK